MKLEKIDPQFLTKHNPRVGLIALATDFMIEKDFIKVIKDKDIDFFVNRIECYNPLTKENLIRMSEKVTEVTNNDGECEGSYNLQTNGTGTWQLSCSNNMGAAGTLKWIPDKSVTGIGRDYNDKKVKFTVSSKS